MARTGTSEKRGTSWLGKSRKLGPHSKATDFDPTEELRDPAFVRKAVLEALEAGDEEAVATIIQAHLRVLNRSTEQR